jgi:TIR domain
MASKPPRPPDAFLSYTRFDDQNDGGAISQFCRRLANSVRAVTGAPFVIFQDVDGIGIGEHWPGKLDEMLTEARFFIPIVTPSYFTSKPCRKELEKFLGAEAKRGRNDLVLPIYYIECDALEDQDLRTADPWRVRFTNASGRTGASFASSRSKAKRPGELWSG